MEAEHLRSENGSKDAVLHCYIAASIKDRGTVTAGSLCSCNFIHIVNNTLEICAALTMTSVVRALISNLLRYNDLVALTDPVALTNPIPLTDVVAFTDVLAFTGVTKFIYYRYRSNNCKISFSIVLLPSMLHF